MKRQLLVSLAVISACVCASAQSPNGWRGPENNGSYPDKGLLSKWPDAGPQMIFETTDAGKGYSSPQVVGDRLYITGLNDQENKEQLSCYSLDGKKLWSVEYGNPWRQSYPEARTTPTYSDGKLYVISGMGEIACIDAKDGKIVWTVDGGQKYQRQTGNWGTSECPLVYDNKVIYTPCGNQTTIVALNKETGEEIWKSRALNEKSGYVSPILITYKGKRQIVGSTNKTAFGADPETGEIMWTFDNWGPNFYGSSGGRNDNIAPNSALYKDGRIFFSHGYDINGFQIQLADDLKSVKLTWRTDVLDTHHGGYVLVNGYIYGSNWVNNNAGNWCCLDWNTGELKYETAWSGKGKGSIITADGKLLLYDERRGTVGLATPDPAKFEVTSEFRITKGSGPYWAHPTISNGNLYIRHGEALYAYKLK